jgi:hypothetical protein
LLREVKYTGFDLSLVLIQIMQTLFKNLFQVLYTMIFRQGIVFSLILAQIRSGLRGFCLTPLISPLSKGGYEGGGLDYRQKKPLKYYTLPISTNIYVMNKGTLRYRKINFFTTSALCKCIFQVNGINFYHYINFQISFHNTTLQIESIK